jgi:subtilisin family serine protease
MWSALAVNMTVLAGCGSSSGGSGPVSALGSCDLPNATTPLANEGSAQDLSDPFETHGKVLISRSLSPDYMSAESTETKAIEAGTELTVVVREQCQNAGAITHTVRTTAPIESQAATPSGVRSYSWTLTQDLDSTQLADMAAGDPCVIGISNSQKSYPTTLSNDPMLETQGHLKMLEAESAYPRIFALNVVKPVVIAVIDTGIDMNHEDLKDVLWKNPGEVAGNGIDDDHNGYVDDVYGYNFANHTPSPQYVVSTGLYHHGTHVAGLAAAQGNNGKGGSGVMGRGAQIMALNVFGSGSGASTADIANAVRYAADNGADVINLSLGGGSRDAAYEAALTYAIKKGVTIVAAAGNERSELGPNYFLSPAGYAQKYAGMIAIGSIDSSNLGLSTYSNWSPTYVELAAPGSEDSAARKGLLSTMPNNKYTRIQGTSMASPVAAGGAALAISMMRSRGYSPSPSTIEAIVENSGQIVPALTGKIRQGRVLNLRLLAEYIDRSFPMGGNGDPAVTRASCSGTN